MGHIAPNGVITEYEVPTPDAGLEDVSIGWGQAWFTERRVGKIGRILRDGSVLEYALPEGSEPVGLTIGDDGSVWYTDAGTNTIARLSGNTYFAVGAGSVGFWDTEFEVVSESGQPDQVYVGIYPPPSACPGQCFYPAIFLDMPPGVRGTARASEIPFWDQDGVWTFMISAWRGDYPVLDTPLAAARILNRARPGRRRSCRSSITGRCSTRSRLCRVASGTRPNRCYAACPPAERRTHKSRRRQHRRRLALRADRLRGRDRRHRADDGSARRAGHGRPALFVNVLSTLPEAFYGSIRITRLSPSGLFWAMLANVYADGRLELLAPTPARLLICQPFPEAPDETNRLPSRPVRGRRRGPPCPRPG